jgi:hypothetical protein
MALITDYYSSSSSFIFLPQIRTRLQHPNGYGNRYILGQTRSKTITECTSTAKLSTIFKVSAQYKLVGMIKYNKNNGIR